MSDDDLKEWYDVTIEHHRKTYFIQCRLLPALVNVAKLKGVRNEVVQNKVAHEVYLEWRGKHKGHHDYIPFKYNELTTITKSSTHRPLTDD